MRNQSGVIFLLFSFLLFLTSINHVFASSLMWTESYGGSFVEIAHSVVQTSDGGYAIAGSTGSYGEGSHLINSFWLVKTDSSGKIEWNQTYGGLWEDTAYSLVTTSDGGYALAGSTESFDAEWHDFWLVKTDSTGNMMWNQIYGGPGWEKAYSLIETSDGGYAMAGETFSDYTGNFLVIKTDRNGNMEWNQTYGGELREIAYSLVETSDGGYAVAGYTWSFSSGEIDCWLVKINSEGNMQWHQSYGGEGSDYAYSLIETSDGGYALIGCTNSFGAGENDFYLIKTDSYGNLMWNRTYGGNKFERAYSLTETSDNGFVLAGETNSIEGNGFDVWLVKTDATGKMIWNQTYGGPLEENAYSLDTTSDRGYILAGRIEDSSDYWTNDFLIIKTDEQGNIPEFPSWIILPFLIFLSSVILITRNKIGKKE